MNVDRSKLKADLKRTAEGLPNGQLGHNARDALRAIEKLEAENARLRALVHPAPATAETSVDSELLGAVRELVSAVGSINRAKHHEVKIAGDESPCYWQRKEWIDWLLELADGVSKRLIPAPAAAPDAKQTDCTPAKAKCVCKICNDASICDEAFDGANDKCFNRVAGEEFCEHPRACHAAQTTEDQEGGTMSDTYTHEQRCTNCNKTNTFEIPKGTPVSGQSKECWKCGCQIQAATFASVFGAKP